MTHYLLSNSLSQYKGTWWCHIGSSLSIRDYFSEIYTALIIKYVNV